MEKVVYLEDFPEQVKIKLRCDFTREMFKKAMKKLKNIEISIKEFDEEFIFGETYEKKKFKIKRNNGNLRYF